MSADSKKGTLFTTTEAIDIAAEFGALPQTPTRNRIDGKTTWTSPRKRGHWGWGHSKNNRSSGSDHNEDKHESSSPPRPARRMSIKNMFSSVRQGVFHASIPTEDKKQDGPAESQVVISLDHKIPPVAVDDTGMHLDSKAR